MLPLLEVMLWHGLRMVSLLEVMLWHGLRMVSLLEVIRVAWTKDGVVVGGYSGGMGSVGSFEAILLLFEPKVLCRKNVLSRKYPRSSISTQ